MPEYAVLRHESGSVPDWTVPVPDGSSPEEVAQGWAASGWSLVSEDRPAAVPAPAPAAPEPSAVVPETETPALDKES